MIGSLLPSVFPTGSFGAPDCGSCEGPAARGGAADPLTMPQGAAAGEDGSRATAGQRGLGPGRPDFVNRAKHMLGDALKTFAHDLRDTFHQLGFQSDMVMRLANDVMHATRQALKSGADFTANLMMAAISQTTTPGDGGTSFAMAAGQIELTVNHSTGEVSVNATQVQIQGQLGSGSDSAAPQLVDFKDTDSPPAGTGAVPVLTSNDLESVLAAGDNSGQPEALGQVLSGVPQDSSGAAAADEEAAPAEASDGAAAEQGEGEAATGAAADGTVQPPQLAGVSHVVITAFQNYLNADSQQITYIKFNAVIPLSTSAAGPSVAETVAEQVKQELTDPEKIFDSAQNPDPAAIPASDQVILQPVGQPATTDLLA